MGDTRRRSLWTLAAPADAPRARFLADAEGRIALRDLACRSSLALRPGLLRGCSVLIATARPLLAALAATELDGIARRLVLCTPDLSEAHLLSAIADAQIDTIVSDGAGPGSAAAPALTAQGVRVVGCSDRLRDEAAEADRDVETQWVLFTSGTTGRPKLALHTLESLAGSLDDGFAAGAVWSSFYDIRRYGGLQILLRALAGGGSMVIASAGEPVGSLLARAGEAGVTHMSGTPSHWRSALISDALGRMSPGYVRLSGEACDQSILDRLRKIYPQAGIAHAFASTEAGVAFEVRDGLAGFPASLMDDAAGPVRMRVRDGSLRIRSSRNAARTLGPGAPELHDEDGFIDTGDLLELRGARYYFVGRRGGIINVGGLKVHPEAVEAVINQHPGVHMSRVSARRSPITGAIVLGEIVVAASEARRGTPFALISRQVLELCRERLAPHQVPALLREAPFLDVAASGKLVRPHA